MKNQDSQSPSLNQDVKASTLQAYTETRNGRITQRCKIGNYTYRTQDLLGEGFSSKVYKASKQNSKQKYAIKMIDLSKFRCNELFLLENQIQIITELDHINIIKCLEVLKTQTFYFLVTEYCPHGDLSELISLQKCIREQNVISIMKQVLDAYKYLASKYILHRDLKPANIFRFGNVWKIGDFGFSKFCKQDYVIEKLYVGTPLYMPPQSLQINKYSIRSDIFALGVIMYEMLAGKTPWEGKNQQQLIKYMKEEGPRIPDWIICEEIKQFIVRATDPDFYTRMSRQELKKFTLQDVDIDKIAKNRPGRGTSPCLQRELAKSGKRSCVLSSVAKIYSSPFIQIGQKLWAKQGLPSSRTLKKENLISTKPSSILRQIDNNPPQQQALKDNLNIVNNQFQFVKTISSAIKSLKVLFLQHRKDKQAFILLLYLLGIKNLKMISSTRQNTFKFKCWDTFKKCEQFKVCITSISHFVTRMQIQYDKYKQGTNQQVFQNINENLPELTSPGSISYKTFSIVSAKLKSLTLNKITFHFNKISQQNMEVSFELIKCLAMIFKCLKQKTKQDDQRVGFGIKDKILFDNKSKFEYDKEVKDTLKSLQNLCKDNFD